MKTKFAAAILSTLLYAQGLLGFAALATVVLKDRANAAEAPYALALAATRRSN